MKESLQEATRRALLEGYKNLRENKSKKVETKLESKKVEGKEPLTNYRIISLSDGRKIMLNKKHSTQDFQKAMKDAYKKVKDTIKDNDMKNEVDIVLANVDPSFDWLELEDVNESKKVEAYSYNWRDDIEEVDNTEENDELVYSFAENLIATDPDYAEYDDPWEVISNIISIWKIEKRSRLYDYLLKWYGSEEEMKKHIRSCYETNNAIYFETGCGYSIFDADLLGGNADGRTADEFGRFVANGGKKEESKKVEAKEELSSPDYLEKAFEVEVEYWLQALVDEDSNDEIGKKAQEVLNNKAKMKSIVDELVNGSDDLWEDIHRKIEELAGLHYRESSRVNESKKVTESLDIEGGNYDYIIISASDDYKRFILFDHNLTNGELERIGNAIDEVISTVEDYEEDDILEAIDSVVPYITDIGLDLYSREFEF